MLLLDIGNVGSGGVELSPEQVELQGLFFFGLVGGFSSGGHFGLEQVLDFLHRLPGLGSLLGRGRGGLRL